MRRRGVSLVEVLVAVAVAGLLAAVLVPAAQKARAAADRLACANNLRQIGLAAHHYHDAVGTLPPARTCPAPWRGGADPDCRGLPAPDAYTGPAEAWWAPYDNRPGATPTQALPVYVPAGVLLPYLGGTTGAFRCPRGLDVTPDSPTFGRPFQVGYALHPGVGGKRLTDPDVPGPLAWEHDDLPACPGPAAHWAPAGTPPDPGRHFARRHLGAMNVLFLDGRVEARTD